MPERRKKTSHTAEVANENIQLAENWSQEGLREVNESFRGGASGIDIIQHSRLVSRSSSKRKRKASYHFTTA
jgi:hypothetical protein